MDAVPHRCSMLVIAPLQPMYDTWENEARKWGHTSDLTFSYIHGKDKAKALETKADVYLINPEGVQWLYTRDEIPAWNVLCVDESTRWKKGSGPRFRALKKLLPSFHWRWILTGTPAPQGLIDLFGQSFIMDCGQALGPNITQYRRKYFYQSGYGGYTWLPHEDSLERITGKLADHVLMLKAEDHLTMPDVVEVTRKVRLSDEIMKEHYEPLKRDFLLELGADTVIAPNAAALGTKLRQVANGAIYREDGTSIPLHSEKLENLRSLMEETKGHAKIVVYEFKFDRSGITNLLDTMKVPYRFIKAGTDIRKSIDDFRSGKAEVLLAHAGSLHGVNVQDVCHHLIYYSMSWSLENYLQTLYRVYRQGQTQEQVFVYNIVAEDTMDGVVLRAIRAKEATQDKINQAIAGE